MNEGETYVVELTPHGRAAVAVVLVEGPRAVACVDQSFTPAAAASLRELPPGRIALGRWGGPAGEEVIACRRDERRVEVHCHGGVAAVGRVIDRLVSAGCRRCDWDEWLRTTEPDPIRAAAQVALARAPTARTASILLDQHHGALATALHAALDSAVAERWSDVADQLDRILAMRAVGMHLVSPWRVVIAGPPNVGKSSLLNAIAGYQRAIVSPLAGTTRDVVTLETAIDGWPVQLADTAGLRAASDELEEAGVALAGQAIADAELLLAVREAGSGLPSAADDSPPSQIRIDVWNKADLLSADQREATRKRFAGRGNEPILTSALTGEGISTLVAGIGQRLVPTPPPAGAAVPFAADQLAALDRARAAVEGRDRKSIRGALHALLPR